MAPQAVAVWLARPAVKIVTCRTAVLFAAQAVYIWPSLAVDLTPNAGLWWYMFTEVFDRFRPYVASAVLL